MKPLVIYGVNAVAQALCSPMAIESVQLATGLRDNTRREMEQMARDRGVPVLRVHKKELDRMTAGGVHQGVLAVCGLPPKVDLEELAEREGPGRTVLLCLDEVQDPRNLGALARSALAFGATGLVLPERRSAGLTAAAIKASAGALCVLPVAQETNLARALDTLKEKGFWVTGAALEDGRSPWEFDPGDRVALVLGSEGKGLRPGVRSRLDHVVRIPMAAGSESLNVSVAGALLLYEWLARPRS